MRAERAERRSAAVEEEMTDMARQNAREIASLKLRISEKDAQLAGGFGSSSALMLGELGASGTQEELRRPYAEHRPPRGPHSAPRRQSPRLDPLRTPGGGAFSPLPHERGEAAWG